MADASGDAIRGFLKKKGAPNPAKQGGVHSVSPPPKYITIPDAMHRYWFNYKYKQFRPSLGGSFAPL